MPGQPLAVGVIVKVTSAGVGAVLVIVPEIGPEPLATMPVTEPVLSRVQSNVVPATGPEKSICVIAVP